MTISARFQTAISNAGPRGARAIESYSPKLGRRLRCFGEAAFRQWICLEADPLVEAFCERPVYLDTGTDERLADFWMRQADSELLLVLDAQNQTSSITIGE